ncbi:MAG: hypothetical protein A2Z16_17045 [Chloroflexi bacterium RBG_16_54_18]|nr:MAG: hypothetical protein A2Z16_17045 [Chloroflexi bacterium RBG_16_54_18]
MKLEKKEYTTRAEKQKDFAIGVGVFIILNAILYTLSVYGSLSLPDLFAGDDPERGYYFFPLACCFFSLSTLINIALLIYFNRTRVWIAAGMLVLFGFIMLIALIAGAITTVSCFTL